MDILLQPNAALDQDRSTMQFVIIALLIVAVLLGMLTIWYWKQTDPAKSRSTISGASRYNDDSYDDFYGDDGLHDDGYQAQPDSYVSEDRRRPVVRHGHQSSAAATQPASGDDAWAAMTGASPNDRKPY